MFTIIKNFTHYIGNLSFVRGLKKPPTMDREKLAQKTHNTFFFNTIRLLDRWQQVFIITLVYR